MADDILSTLEHDAELGEGTILFGGSGFLGSYILHNYPKIISVGRSPCPTKNRHIPVTGLDDLRPLADIAFNKVIYTIGNMDPHGLERKNISREEPNAFDYHVMPLIKVMEQLKGRDIRKFIHFSSILLYDETRISLPISEHSPINPYKNRYTMSKYLAEELCKFYRDWMPIVNCRLYNIYGPTPLRRFDLIHTLTHKLLDDGKAKTWSTAPSRDFLYVEDAAHAIVKLLYADYNSTLVLGSGTMTPIKRVVEIMQEISGCPITSREQPVSGPSAFRADLSTLLSLIEWRPRISIEEGIRRTFEFEKKRRGR